MQTFNILKKSKIKDSFRNNLVINKFDLQIKNIEEEFSGQIDIPENWNIGVIVGNSGTGKSIIAKQLFKNNYINKFDYDNNSIIDNISKDIKIDEILKVLGSVGFSTPKSWLKSYHVLSNGECMRVDLARAILEKNDLIVFDEYTSVIDRNVAKFGSLAIQKSIRKLNKQFIAVSCHFDILEWLQPDWIFDTNKMDMIKVKKNHKYELKYLNIEINQFGNTLANIII